MSTADLLDEQVRALAACAERLSRIRADLGDDAPPWFHATVEAHLDACAVAAQDLARAAESVRGL